MRLDMRHSALILICLTAVITGAQGKSDHYCYMNEIPFLFQVQMILILIATMITRMMITLTTTAMTLTRTDTVITMTVLTPTRMATVTTRVQATRRLSLSLERTRLL